MNAMRWTVVLAAFAAIGSFAGFSAGNRHPDVARSAYLAFSAKAPPPAVGEKILFQDQGACSVPVIDERVVFKGGLTSGEQVSMRLDTSAKTYRFQIDATRESGRRATLRTGQITFDEQDCSFVLSGDRKVRIAINRDGVLFGSITNDGAAPVRMIAFSSVSNRLADLAGDWRIVGHGSRPVQDGVSLRSEARIRVDGTYSRCSLTHVSPMDCIPDTGRIALGHNAFTTIETDGHRGDLIIGRVGDRLVPILLRPNDKQQGLHFLIPQFGGASAASQGKRDQSPLRQHAQVVSPVFHR